MSEDQFRILAESANDGIVIASGEGVHVYANRRAAEILGYTVNELVGTTNADLVDPDELPKVAERLKKRLRGEPAPSQYEVLAVRKDGTRLPVELTAAKTTWQGAPADMIVFRDITRRKEAEETLRHREARFRSLVQNSSDIIMVVGPDGTISYVSPSMARILGYRSEAVLGSNVFDFVHPDDVGSVRQDFVSVAQGTMAPAPRQLRIRNAEGAWVWIEGIATNLLADPDVAGLVINARDISDRKRAENALRQSEENWRSVTENSPDHIMLLDRDAKIEFINHTVPDLDRDEVVGTPIYDYVPPEFRPDIEACFQRVLKTGRPDQYEVDYYTAEGEVQSFEARVGPVTRDGQVVGLAVDSTDVTARKRAAERLRSSEQRYRTLFEGANDAIFIMDQDRFVDCNQMALKMFWCETKEEVVGRTAWEFGPPTQPDGQDSRSKGEPLIGAALAGEPQRFYWKCKRKDGALIDTEMSLSRMDLVSKVYVQAAVRDITARRQAEEALRESEERFKAIAEATPITMAITRMADGQILYANDNFFQTFGLAGSGIAEISTPDVYVHPSDRQLLLQALRRDGKLVGHELELKRADGTRFWVLGAFQVLTFDGEEAIFGSLHDITDRKRMEKQLRASEEQLRSLAKRLAQSEETERQRLSRELHDRTGQELAALGISLNLLRGQLAEEGLPEAADRLDDALDQVEQTARHVRDLMSDLRPAVLDDYGVPAALRWYADQFTKRTGVSLDVAEHGEVPRMPRDLETALFRIAQEALTNVAKHARAKKATVSLSATERGVEMAVTDDGAGFDVDEQARSTEGGRWGMVTMRERALAVGGSLQVESKPGKGTRVTAEVPGG